MDYVQIAVELFFGFVALFIITKILGKNQITQITPFDFISALVLGELVGNALYDENIGISKILFTVFLWGALVYIMEIITQKFKGARNFLEGQPAIIIRKGQILRSELKKNKLDLNQLQHLLRSKDVFSLREVEYALLETDGTVSVLKKSKYEKVTRDDMNLPDIPVPIPISVILDGEVNWDNLQLCGFDEKWLKGQLQVHGISEFKDVLYAEYIEGEALHIVKM